MEHSMSTRDAGSRPNDRLALWPVPYEGVPTPVFAHTLPASQRPTARHKALEVMLWWGDTLLSVVHCAEPRVVTIGEGRATDFHIAGGALPAPRFDLIEPCDDGVGVNWDSQMMLEVQRENGSVIDGDGLEALGYATRFPSGVRQFRLGLHDQAAIQLGALTFVARYVAPARKLRRSLVNSIDIPFLTRFGNVAIASAFVLGLLLVTPPDPAWALTQNVIASPTRITRLVLEQPQTYMPKPEPAPPATGGTSGRQTRSGGPAGAERFRRDVLPRTETMPRRDSEHGQHGGQRVKDSEIFEVLDQVGAVREVLEPGSVGAEIDDLTRRLRATRVGDAGGTVGPGTRGPAAGADPSAHPGESLGIHDLGKELRDGVDASSSLELGRGKPRLGVPPGGTTAKGCLTSEVVLRTLSRATSQAKYCYDKELTRSPDLEGKVTTRFIIGPSGAVQSVEILESTLRNSGVEHCLIGVVRRTPFPPCAGGNVAEVTYPWIFTAGGRTADPD